jgi:hypothetical protein
MTDPRGAESAAHVEKSAGVEGQPATAAPSPPRARWRTLTATVLITLGCLLAPLAVVAVWASDEVSDTDRYVQTVAPLADDPAVQKAVTDRVTQEVFTYVDVKALTNQALAALSGQGVSPQVTAQLQALSAPLASSVQSFTHDQIARIVAGPRFATAWERANRAAHQQLVNLLEGNQTGAVTNENGAVTVNLGPLVAQAKAQLVAQGLPAANKIPAVNTSFTLVQSDKLGKAQAGYRALNALGRWLPLIALALIALGVYVAKGHRRALVGAGLGVAASMLVLGAALAIARPLYLDALPATASQNAAGAVFDTLVTFLRQALRATLVAGLIIAAGAFLTGGSIPAVRTRGGLVHGIGALRGGAESAGLHTGGLGAWVHAQRRWLRIGAVAAGLAALVFWPHPTGAVVIWLAIGVLVLVGIVEFLARPPAPAPTAPAGAATAPVAVPR